MSTVQHLQTGIQIACSAYNKNKPRIRREIVGEKEKKRGEREKGKGEKRENENIEENQGLTNIGETQRFMRGNFPNLIIVCLFNFVALLSFPLCCFGYSSMRRD